MMWSGGPAGAGARLTEAQGTGAFASCCGGICLVQKLGGYAGVKKKAEFYAASLNTHF